MPTLPANITAKPIQSLTEKPAVKTPETAPAIKADKAVEKSLSKTPLNNKSEPHAPE